MREHLEALEALRKQIYQQGVDLELASKVQDRIRNFFQSQELAFQAKVEPLIVEAIENRVRGFRTTLCLQCHRLYEREFKKMKADRLMNDLSAETAFDLLDQFQSSSELLEDFKHKVFREEIEEWFEMYFKGDIIDQYCPPPLDEHLEKVQSKNQDQQVEILKADEQIEADLELSIDHHSSSKPEEVQSQEEKVVLGFEEPSQEGEEQEHSSDLKMKDLEESESEAQSSEIEPPVPALQPAQEEKPSLEAKEEEEKIPQEESTGKNITVRGPEEQEEKPPVSEDCSRQMTFPGGKNQPFVPDAKFWRDLQSILPAMPAMPAGQFYYFQPLSSLPPQLFTSRPELDPQSTHPQSKCSMNSATVGCCSKCRCEGGDGIHKQLDEIFNPPPFGFKAEDLSAEERLPLKDEGDQTVSRDSSRSEKQEVSGKPEKQPARHKAEKKEAKAMKYKEPKNSAKYGFLGQKRIINPAVLEDEGFAKKRKQIQRNEPFDILLNQVKKGRAQGSLPPAEAEALERRMEAIYQANNDVKHQFEASPEAHQKFMVYFNPDGKLRSVRFLVDPSFKRFKDRAVIISDAAFYHRLKGIMRDRFALLIFKVYLSTGQQNFQPPQSQGMLAQSFDERSQLEAQILNLEARAGDLDESIINDDHDFEAAPGSLRGSLEKEEHKPQLSRISKTSHIANQSEAAKKLDQWLEDSLNKEDKAFQFCQLFFQAGNPVQIENYLAGGYYTSEFGFERLKNKVKEKYSITIHHDESDQAYVLVIGGRDDRENINDNYYMKPVLQNKQGVLGQNHSLEFGGVLHKVPQLLTARHSCSSFIHRGFLFVGFGKCIPWKKHRSKGFQQQELNLKLEFSLLDEVLFPQKSGVAPEFRALEIEEPGKEEGEENEEFLNTNILPDSSEPDTFFVYGGQQPKRRGSHQQHVFKLMIKFSSTVCWGDEPMPESAQLLRIDSLKIPKEKCSFAQNLPQNKHFEPEINSWVMLDEEGDLHLFNPKEPCVVHKNPSRV